MGAPTVLAYFTRFPPICHLSLMIGDSRRLAQLGELSRIILSFLEQCKTVNNSHAASPASHSSHPTMATSCSSAPYAATFAFCEDFQALGDDGSSLDSWVKSGKDSYSQQEVVARSCGIEGLEEDMEMVLTRPNQHYGLSAPFRSTVRPNDAEELVIQYEAAFTEGLSCGGSYVKILRADQAGSDELTHLSNDTGYSVMFGPDRCGSTNKVHFIIQLRNRVTGAWEEKHLSSAKSPKVPGDTRHHLYTLAVRSDGSFRLLVDLEEVAAGSLLEDLDPPVNPPSVIPDPDDEKPDDWVDDPRVPDPNAVKPDDWDEEEPPRIPDQNAVMPAGWLEDVPATVPDPDAEEPEDWDEEDDGEWIAPDIANPECADATGCGPWKRPTISNPAFRGKWRAPMIDNPAYKGPWQPRDIPNPDFFYDPDPFRSIPPMSAAAIEVWTTNSGLAFDNIIVGSSIESALAYGDLTWGPKALAEQAAEAARASKPETVPLSASGSDFLSQVRSFAELSLQRASNDPVAAAGTAAVLLVTFFLLLRPFWGSKKRTAQPAPEPEPAVVEGYVETKSSGTPPKRRSARQAQKADSPVTKGGDKDD